MHVYYTHFTNTQILFWGGVCLHLFGLFFVICAYIYDAKLYGLICPIRGIAKSLSVQE